MYSCDMCKRTFSQYGLLEEHLKVDHNRTGKTSGHAAFQPLSAADSKPQGQVAAFLSQFISGGKMSPPIGSVSAVTRGRPTLASRGNFGLSVMKPKCNKPNILQSSSQKPNPPSLPAAEKRKPNGPVELIVNPQPAKKMRYNCTPCALKFNAYSDVLQHWEVRHLKQLRVKLCRFDQCEICLSDLKKTCQIPYDMGQLLITIETPISPGGDDMLTKSVPEEIVLDDD